MEDALNFFLFHILDFLTKKILFSQDFAYFKSFNIRMENFLNRKKFLNYLNIILEAHAFDHFQNHPIK